MAVEMVRVRSVKDLPENETLEELRVLYKKEGEIRQEVVLKAKRIGDSIFSVEDDGKVIKKEHFPNIIWLSFINRN